MGIFVNDLNIDLNKIMSKTNVNDLFKIEDDNNNHIPTKNIRWINVGTISDKCWPILDKCQKRHTISLQKIFWPIFARYCSDIYPTYIFGRVSPRINIGQLKKW